MTPQKQNILCNKELGTLGNCLQASVASLLDIPIYEVPHFITFKNWTEVFINYIEGCGYTFDGTIDDWKDYKGIDGYYILVGSSPRIENGTHAVIYKDGKPFFDPHPDDTFVTKEMYVLGISLLNFELKVHEYPKDDFKDMKFPD